MRDLMLWAGVGLVLSFFATFVVKFVLWSLQIGNLHNWKIFLILYITWFVFWAILGALDWMGGRRKKGGD